MGAQNNTVQNVGAVQNEMVNGNDIGRMGDDGRLIGRPQGHAPTVATMILNDTGKMIDPSTAGKTIGDMMDAFKSINTVEYIHGVKQSGWELFNGKLWQRNY